MKAIIIFLMILLISIPVTANGSTCNLTDGITVQTKQGILYICEHNQIIKEYCVSLGRKGVGKKCEGDEKTPIGIYELAQPKQSSRFGLFILIKYPTPQQISAGFTGKDVGIHGPPQLFSWLGPINVLFNWTQGCVAVGSNDQMAFIAQWVQDHPQIKISII